MKKALCTLALLLASSVAHGQGYTLIDFYGVGFSDPKPESQLTDDDALQAYLDGWADYNAQADHWEAEGWETYYVNNYIETERSGGQAMYVFIVHGIRWHPDEILVRAMPERPPVTSIACVEPRASCLGSA